METKPWYKNWWGVLLAICIWPIFLIWYVYNKTNWSEGVKGITTVAIVLVFIVGLAVAGSKDPVVDDTEQVKTVKTHTPNAQTTPEPPDLGH